jgi:hypothetical protein
MLTSVLLKKVSFATLTEIVANIIGKSKKLIQFVTFLMTLINQVWT